jgi:exocyst complex component 1
MTEKDFFVGSLVKIYRKYTSGKEPLLTGFSQSEMNQIGPLTSQRPRTPQSSTSRTSPSPSPALKTGGTDFSGSGLSPDSASLPHRPPSSGASSMRTTESHDRIPPLPGQFPSDNPRSLRGHDKSRSRGSQNDLHGGEPRSDTLRPPSRDNKPRGLDPASSTESFHSSRLNAQTPPTIGGMDRLRSNGTYSPLARAESASDIPEPGPRSPERNNSARRWGSAASNQDALPERRRPPIEEEKLKRYSNETPSPLEPRRTPRTPANDGQSDEQERGRKANDGDASGAKDVGAPVSGLVSPLSPPADPESPAQEETFRPGLGPMIKKRSQKDIANQFRKAAAAVNAFKPRAGGAGERLRTEPFRQNSASDGINGVFKAPAVGKEALRSPPPGTPDSSVQLNPLDVEMEKKDSTSSLRQSDSRATSFSQKEEEQPKDTKPLIEETPPPAPEERKKKRPTDNSARFAEVLGIPAILLEGRTAEIEACLEDMNWSADEKKRVKTEDLLLECRKELSKAETGTWLSSFEQGDERVSAVSKMLDKAIAECDELDGLLTLYDAELGVSGQSTAPEVFC